MSAAQRCSHPALVLGAAAPWGWKIASQDCSQPQNAGLGSLWGWVAAAQGCSFGINLPMRVPAFGAVPVTLGVAESSIPLGSTPSFPPHPSSPSCWCQPLPWSCHKIQPGVPHPGPLPAAQPPPVPPEPSQYLQTPPQTLLVRAASCCQFLEKFLEKLQMFLAIFLPDEPSRS